jgi:hypothetical protein
MHVRARQVRVTDLEDGGDRWGVLVEADDGRALIALPAASPEELAAQVDEAGGVVGLARRRGLLPLDPQGLAVGEGDAPVWIEPAGA